MSNQPVASVNLSFVLIEYYCSDSICSCVASIRSACKGISYEVIVSSNSSYNEQEQGALRATMPDVRWVFNGHNKGFAGAMNSGVLMTSGEAIALINPDVRLSKGNMRKAFDYLMSHEEVGLIGPRIVDKKGSIQDSCRSFMGPKELLGRISQRISHGTDVLLDPAFDYTATQPVDWVIGAFMMAKRDALEKVGLLDQNYFLYVEDMDWCKRFWDAGFQIVYFPEIEVIYKGDRKSTSSLALKTMPNIYSFYHVSSYLRFLFKNRFRVSRYSSQTAATRLEREIERLSV